MKAISSILVAGLVALGGLGNLAAADNDGVAMKDGRMMTVKDGNKTAMTEDATLKDGTKVTKTGSVTAPDGNTWTLKDGDTIAWDGTYRTRVVKDGVIMKDGEVMSVKAGEKTALSSELTLSDGTKVTTDGNVTSKDGKNWKLKNGDIILMDGRVLLEGSVIMKEGKAMIVKDCMGTPLKDEVSLEGIKVQPDGAVTLKDGSTTTLKDNDVIQKDGTYLEGGKAE